MPKTKVARIYRAEKRNRARELLKEVRSVDSVLSRRGRWPAVWAHIRSKG